MTYEQNCHQTCMWTKEFASLTLSLYSVSFCLCKSYCWEKLVLYIFTPTFTDKVWEISRAELTCGSEIAKGQCGVSGLMSITGVHVMQ